MKRNYFLTALTLLVSLVSPQKMLADDPDLTAFTVVKSMDFTKSTYPSDVNITLASSQQGTAYETGNKRQQIIYDVATPEELSGYLAFQGVYPNKGWRIRPTSGGLYSVSAQRSAAVLNCKKDYLVAFNCSQDASKVITLTNADSEPDGPFTYVQSEDTKTYYATLTADGQVGFCGNKTVGFITSIVIYAPADALLQPTAEYTAVNGKQRTVTFSGTNLAYNTDGGETYTNFKDGDGKNVNTAEVTVSENTTYYVVSTNGDKKSDPLKFEIEAGEELSLVIPTYAISAMGEGFTKTYSVACDNSGVLLKPTAKLTYDFTPSAGGTSESNVEFDGKINAAAAGVYTVTASADGYTSTTVTIDNTTEYELTKTFDFTALTADDLSDNWKLKTADTQLPGKWYTEGKKTATTSWYYYDFAAETADATKMIDGLTLPCASNGTTMYLYTSYGLMLPLKKMTEAYEEGETWNNSASVSLTNGSAEQIAVYSYMTNYGKSSDQTSVLAGNEAYSLYRYQDILTKIEVYSPTGATKTFSATKLASFSAASNTVVPEGVSVYTAKVSGDNVVLTKVETSVIPANTGVIVKSDAEGEKTFKATVDGTEASFEGNELIATSVAANATVPSEGTYYALSASEAKFGVLTGGITLSGNKAYLAAPTADGAKLSTLNVVFGDETTGINTAAQAAQADGAYYTLQGVKTQKPAKGLYIHNGKKVVVK